MWLATTGTPFSVVDEPSFVNLIHELNSKFPLPGRKGASNCIDEVYEKLKMGINDSLSNGGRVSVCVDLWSRRNLTASYVAVTAHYFDNKNHRLQRALLGIRKIFSPHTAEKIRDITDDILLQWNIPYSRLFKVATDNGTNVVKAFRESREPDMNPNRELNYAEMAIAAEAQVDFVDEDYFNEQLNDSFDDNRILYELAEFANAEVDSVAQFGSNLRISCFDHSLQCSLRNCVDKDREFQVTAAKMMRLIHRIKQSTSASSKLLEQSGLSLAVPARTRWNFMYYAIKRFLTVFEPLKEVVDEMGWDNLSNSEVAKVNEYINVIW